MHGNNEAEDLQTHTHVAVKELSVARAKDLKSLELFSREVEVLRQLDHPGIPRFLDHVDGFLVQTLARGTDLGARMADGWRPDEAEVKRIAREVLGILSDLHGLVPPVVHRDLKPSNLVMRDDGFVQLVDFGSVRDVVRRDGSTVVGTYGYMAPEQYRGDAGPRTDLYGLGALLVHVLARTSPAEIEHRRNKLDVCSAVEASPELVAWLEWLLEPAMEDRPRSAEEALRALDAPSALALQTPPEGSAIGVSRSGDRLELVVRPAGLFASENLVLLFVAAISAAFTQELARIDMFHLDSAGNVFVATHPYNTVERVSVTGERTTVATLAGPTDVEVLPDGTLLVVQDGGAFLELLPPPLRLLFPAVARGKAALLRLRPSP